MDRPFTGHQQSIVFDLFFFSFAGGKKSSRQKLSMLAPVMRDKLSLHYACDVFCRAATRWTMASIFLAGFGRPTLQDCFFERSSTDFNFSVFFLDELKYCYKVCQK